MSAMASLLFRCFLRTDATSTQEQKGRLHGHVAPVHGAALGDLWSRHPRRCWCASAFPSRPKASARRRPQAWEHLLRCLKVHLWRIQQRPRRGRGCRGRRQRDAQRHPPTRCRDAPVRTHPRIHGGNRHRIHISGGLAPAGSSPPSRVSCRSSRRPPRAREERRRSRHLTIRPLPKQWGARSGVAPATIACASAAQCGRLAGDGARRRRRRLGGDEDGVLCLRVSGAV